MIAILAVGAVLGIPNGFNNLGLQTALYEATPAAHRGAAGGLFQTFRYVGAILSSSLPGLVLGTTVTTGGLLVVARMASRRLYARADRPHVTRATRPGPKDRL